MHGKVVRRRAAIVRDTALAVPRLRAAAAKKAHLLPAAAAALGRLASMTAEVAPPLRHRLAARRQLRGLRRHCGLARRAVQMLPRRAARRARPPSRLSADRRGRSPYASVSPMQPNQSGLPVDLLILSGRQIPVGWAPVGRSAAESIRDQYELVLRYNCTDLL